MLQIGLPHRHLLLDVSTSCGGVEVPPGGRVQGGTLTSTFIQGPPASTVSRSTDVHAKSSKGG